MKENLKQVVIVLVSATLIAFASIFVVRYFYPNLDTKKNEFVSEEDLVPQIQLEENVASSSVTVSPNAKGNLVLKDIRNARYVVDQKEISFSEGKAIPTFGLESQIKLYAFGDVNSDSNGDAVVVLETSLFVGTSTQQTQELYVVLNKEGLARSVHVSPYLDGGFEIKSFKKINISDGKIMMDVMVDEKNGLPFKDRREVFKFVSNSLIRIDEKAVWKKYKNDEFGFEFSYLDGSSIVVRPIIEDGRDLPNSLFVSVSAPFLTTYNTWTKKNFTIYVKKGACPYRNDAIIVNKKNIEFHEYSPDSTKTSNTETVSFIRELMVYHGTYCFTLLSKIEGPGALSPDFPKVVEAKSPDNLENFLKIESLILEQILDTFRFISQS